MLDKIKRNAYLVVGIFFLWQGWSGTQVEGAVEEEKSEQRMPAIRASYIREGESQMENVGGEGADATEASVAPRDPFGLAKLKLAMIQQDRAMAELGVHDGSGFDAEVDTVSKTKHALNLQSTMNAGGVWVARINGHTLRVGDQLPGFDEEAPPVLVSVEGLVAQLRYNGLLVTLDLSGEASVSVE